MKILHIVRHAEAVSKTTDIPDFERALVKKGVKGARAVARRLRRCGFSADAMVSSPANRAMETAHVFAQELNFPVDKIELNRTMYENSDRTSLLTLVHGFPGESSDAFLFGHDPSFSEFAKHMVQGFDSVMPKGAVVTVAFETDSWADVGPGQGKLIGFDYPMSKTEETRRYKSARKEIATILVTAMNHELQRLDSRAAEIMKPFTDKTARKAAERFIELAPSVVSGTRAIPRADEKGERSASPSDC